PTNGAYRAQNEIVPAKKTAARVTTRTGDRGTTSLFGKGRVAKSDPRVVALGDLDEAQSAIGVVRAMTRAPLATTLLALQRGLYLAMAEVATPRSDLARIGERIDAEALARIDELSQELRAHGEPRF